MYTTMLTIHSWMRWLTLLLAITATINAFRTPTPDRPLPGRWWDTLFMLVIDLQVLIGLALYFGMSPFTLEAMNNMGLAMKTPQLRFWAIEHPTGMFAAFIILRIGRVLAANSASPAVARNRRATCFAVATLIIIASIPWPGLPYGRGLFRY
jgi:hypothetical protein